MQAFAELAASGKIDIDLLTTHTFDFDKAVSAYDMIMNRTEAFTGLLLKYDINKKIPSKISVNQKELKSGMPALGFIGAGSFAQKFLIPNVKDANLVGVATGSGFNAKNICDKFGFNYCTGKPGNRTFRFRSFAGWV